MFFKGIPWTAHLSEQTQTRPGERYQHAHKSSCFPLGQGKNQINKNVAAKFPFPAASPPSSPRPRSAPFLPAPQTEPEVEDIQSESEPKHFTKKRKTAPFPSKVCPRLVPSAPILHKPQPATPATGPSPASAGGCCCTWCWKGLENQKVPQW